MRVRQIEKPQRWDRPFGETPLPARDVEAVLSLPVFEDIDPRDFPDDLPLDGIIANDARIIHGAPGDVVYRQGEYGTSVFMVLSGTVRSIMTRGAGQASAPKSSAALSRLMTWFRPNGKAAAGKQPTAEPDHATGVNGGLRQASCAQQGAFSPPVLPLGRHEVFGVIGALTRGPRSSSVMIDDDDTRLLEVRWPGVRDLSQLSDAFGDRLDDMYREWAFWDCLQGCALFHNVDDDTLSFIADSSSFERYGEFGWSHRFQKHMGSGDGPATAITSEPVVAEQDHYLDGLLLIHAGTARLTEKLRGEERTTGFAAKNDIIGLSEIAGGVEAGGDLRFPNSLRAVGYVDLVRIPTQIVETCILPSLPPHYDLRGRRSVMSGSRADTPDGPALPRTSIEFLIENRFTNGVKAMAINTDRCVNCDDCVRACAAAHDGVPRFVRQGATHHNLMIAGACMHCVDPVCLIDCPTSAIHRDKTTGTVIIDDATCIGCAACANACPYDNIQMSERRDAGGAFLVDESGVQALRAEKCDLCAGRSGGPACVRACPHDALMRVNIRDPGSLLAWLEPALQ